LPPHTSDLIPIAAPDIGTEEEEAVLRVLRSGHLVQGPEVERLEEEFAAACGVDHAVAVASGTAALHAALWAAGVRSGDEVLVPAFTFAATANAVMAVGAVPRFVDVGDDFLMDLDHAEALVGERTTAILPVHLYGLMADMARVTEMASRLGLAVIEDAAQAHLARREGRVAGASGVGAFSFYATKNMMCGEGGMVTSDDADVALAVRRLRNHGMESRYVHEEWGLNLRLTDLSAAIARVQLRKLEQFTARRRSNAAYFTANLSSFYRPQPVPPDAFHVYHQYVVRVDARHRDHLLDGLRSRGVGADVYYPSPVNHQPAFSHLQQHDTCPRASTAAGEVLALPVHPAVDEEARAKIVDVANLLAEGLS
jgi:dTDP-4-amino-4,6-dideoxygalactose transaminase